MRKTTIFSFLLILFQNIITFSQNLDWAYGWGYQPYGQIGQVYAEDAETDSQGNTYVISNGNSQVDFDPTNGTFLGTTSFNSVALSKFDVNGNLIWVKLVNKVSGASADITARELCVKNGKIYFTGILTGNYDFDPNGGVSTFGSNGGNFLTVWDTNGNYFWTKTFGTGGIVVRDIKVDNSGNIYLTGNYNQTMNFFNAGSISPVSGSDIFIGKVDNLGVGQWVNSYGSNYPLDESGESITILNDQSIVFTGYFGSTIDFDPGASINNFVSNGLHDIFIQRIDPSNNILWTHTAGSAQQDRGHSIISDNSDNIFLSGVISNSVDFSSWGTSLTLTGLEFNGDSFFLKLNSNCQISWGKVIVGGGNSNYFSQALSLVTDNSKIYLTGIFNGTIDFDPNIGIYNITSSSNGSGNYYNTYYLILNYNGDFYSAGHFHGTGNYLNYPNSISIGGGGIYISGTFKGSVDFDPSSSTYNLNSAINNASTPDYSAYLVKLNGCISTSSSITQSSCNSYIAPNGTNYNSSGTYTATIPNAAGCDSLITIDLTILL